MATLIPALGSCVSRMTGGARRVAERLEQKLDDDYLLWYDVPVGPRSAHPDFVIIHPRRGILVLEVKDFRLSTLIQADRQNRVIHGVAGSGKTMLLGYRAEHLAKAQTAASKPILILCYNEPLARQIARVMAAKGIADRVHAVHFHKWCYAQLRAYGQEMPANNQPVSDKMADMVQRVITGVDRRQIPSGQYQAVLIDEGHDFAPEWLRLVVQMVDPATNSLLVLYDDAQSIYDRTQKSKNFSFKSVGIQAQGRTTILKINYRNTRQILQTASLVAADLLTAEDKDDDGVPLLKPVSCGRDGEAPLIVRLPTLREEVAQVAELLATAHREGHAWADMAILCRHHSEMDMCAEFLRKRNLPHQLRRNSSSVFDPAHDSIKVMTLHVSHGLALSVVALVGAGRMPAEGEDEREEARLFYVGATRATQRLVIGASGNGKFAARL
ncbi:DEAD/DEAH box helicase [Aquabacterium sp. A08]|uniref:DEAD/DEAH box helicase n=1 Tax=Aquabacterium sp. A08 TaxID=2718532 RepID=UPI001AAFE04A|nr:3'-5' exonuclease [Aquabacterium sp. A08]